MRILTILKLKPLHMLVENMFQWKETYLVLLKALTMQKVLVLPIAPGQKTATVEVETMALALATGTALPVLLLTMLVAPNALNVTNPDLKVPVEVLAVKDALLVLDVMVIGIALGKAIHVYISMHKCKILTFIH